jgi:uncharacterized membrane protein YjgN (DUF898 family)
MVTSITYKIKTSQERSFKMSEIATATINPQQKAESNSYFDGGLLQLIGWSILGFFITVCTLGICYPLALCLVYKWQTKHTVIDGKRLIFEGSAIGLFGLWIKWLLLLIITIGIYSFWVGISLKKWKVRHTHFA